MSTTAIRPLETGPPRSRVQPAVPRLLQRWVERWHLLSLDAPTVAAVWLLTFSRHAALSGRGVAAAALAVAVWLFYAADRLLDVRREGRETLQVRHYFHAKHLRQFAFAAGLAVPVLLLLMLHLPQPVRTAWLWLALPMVAYAAAVHVWPVRRLPKEVAVALMFATATLLPSLLTSASRNATTLCGGALFAAVCWLNCMSIARWEGVGTIAEAASSSTAWGTRHLGTLEIAFALLAATATPWLGMPAAACALSATLLLVLDRAQLRAEPLTLRALADAALLTPLLLLPFIR